MVALLAAGLLGLSLALAGPVESVAQAAGFEDTIERDFGLRSIGQLQITNMRGDITVRGWALDRIRVKAVRRVASEDPEEVKKLVSGVDIRYRASDGHIELSAEYGRGLSIQERLKEREHPKTSLDMVVFAPSHLKLRVWSIDGKVSLRLWSAPAELRSSTGSISVENVKADQVSILCPSCPIQVKSLRASLRCMGGSGNVELAEVKGSNIYVETSTGAQKARNIQGEQLYVAKTGSIHGLNLRGHVEFHTQQGPVEIQEGVGFLSGKTESGDIVARMRDWAFRDKAIIESAKGNITLTLPAAFSGEIDAWSVQGKAETEFLIEKSHDSQVIGPQPESRLTGRIGEGGEILRLFTEKGAIRLLKGN